MLALRCSVQNYDWGRPAADSEVAKLAIANGAVIDESKPFAELWIGSHPALPAKVAGTELTLSEWLSQNRDSLGAAVTNHFGPGHLPFLLKVLSVNKALSIQSHPDKLLAEKLHREHGHLYADDNHKPEMAVALTTFEALCGFVSQQELRGTLVAFPELRAALGQERVVALMNPNASKQALKDAFTAIMRLEQSQVAASVAALVLRLVSESVERTLDPREKLALRLNEQFPHDVGVLSSLFLNLVTLQPGQAIALDANEPHAYLSGEIVECMASSDNVIRAGLTPKHKHVDVLCESLTYRQGAPDVLSGTPVDAHTRVYRPPFDEFEINHVVVPAGTQANLSANEGPSILLVQHGRGTAVTAGGSLPAPPLQTSAPLQRGAVYYLPAGTSANLSAADEALTAWTATVNAGFFARAGAEAIPAHVHNDHVPAPAMQGPHTLQTPLLSMQATQLLLNGSALGHVLAGTPAVAQEATTAQLEGTAAPLPNSVVPLPEPQAVPAGEVCVVDSPPPPPLPPPKTQEVAGTPLVAGTDPYTKPSAVPDQLATEEADAVPLTAANGHKTQAGKAKSLPEERETSRAATKLKTKTRQPSLVQAAAEMVDNAAPDTSGADVSTVPAADMAVVPEATGVGAAAARRAASAKTASAKKEPAAKHMLSKQSPTKKTAVAKKPMAAKRVADAKRREDAVMPPPVKHAGRAVGKSKAAAKTKTLAAKPAPTKIRAEAKRPAAASGSEVIAAKSKSAAEAKASKTASAASAKAPLSPATSKRAAARGTKAAAAASKRARK